MLKLIPAVKTLEMHEGTLSKKAICYDRSGLDDRLVKALGKLPQATDGARLKIDLTGGDAESYTLRVERAAIGITAQSPAGAFYAIQTLRQLFSHGEVPCLYIEDAPDFPHRGFYHDVTRGRIPMVDTVKQLIDDMAYYKLNSLQLYVEHVFPFRETEELVAKTGCMTPEEMRELEAYCEENFITFIPSLSTFGHMFEILNQPQYQHLAILSDYKADPNFWWDRMRHHTINPLKEGSLELVESLIDQYLPLFQNNFFNICCDETFDLDRYLECDDPGKVYAEFVKKIIGLVRARGRDVMMWADILLKHPEVIDDIPDETVFLNWFYRVPVPEENIAKLAQMGKKQIVCPGTTTWNRLCEDVEVEEENISKMAEYGYKYGALGVLNTNWGDWGNPCSMELGMYGMVLGAEKAWSVHTPVDDAFYSRVNHLLYGVENGIQYLKTVSNMHKSLIWRDFVRNYYALRDTGKTEYPTITAEAVTQIQKDHLEMQQALSGQTWQKDSYRKELLSAAEGLCVLAELSAKMAGIEVARCTDTKQWLAAYSENWLAGNKPSELDKLVTFLMDCEEMK